MSDAFNIVKETIAFVERFQDKHPGKRISITAHGLELVDATPEEEAAWLLERSRAAYRIWLLENATISKSDAEELRMARWILQKHSTTLAAIACTDELPITKLLDAIDTITSPNLNFPEART